MSKRYREALEEVETHASRQAGRSTEPDQPLAFSWRGRRYLVTQIIGHWREEEGWWRRPDGEPIRIHQSDLWRLEAIRQPTGPRSARSVAETSGVYELASRGGNWRLDRVWD